jgi:hypothetical protein
MKLPLDLRNLAAIAVLGSLAGCQSPKNDEDIARYIAESEIRLTSRQHATFYSRFTENPFSVATIQIDFTDYDLDGKTDKIAGTVLYKDGKFEDFNLYKGNPLQKYLAEKNNVSFDKRDIPNHEVGSYGFFINTVNFNPYENGNRWPYLYDKFDDAISRIKASGKNHNPNFPKEIQVQPRYCGAIERLLLSNE